MSKLVDSSQVYLNKLLNLNLYSPTNVYDLKSSSLNKVLSTIISVVDNNTTDFSNSILGRVLLPNTPIQKIGNVELAKALALRVGKNLRTNVLPSITVNNGKISLTEANYWNISGNDNSSNFSTIVETILGFQPPVNPIPFISDNFSHKASDEYLKGNRGKGQIDAYLANIEKNNYSPDDEDNQYGTIEDISNENSILYKTNQIINDNTLGSTGYPALAGKQGDSINPNALAYYNIGTTGDTKLISHGDGTYTDDTKKTFLRVYNQNKKYFSTSDLMKFKHGTAGSNSVLQTVFPNIYPSSKSSTNIKNLMFSIENLAFADGGTHQLKPYEIGSNDGRIMWFPPYDLNFNEDTNNDWEAVKFVGRTEPVYTYNGSEKSFNLSFKLIVDTPSALWDNSWKNATNNEYDKFFRQDNISTKNLSVGDNDSYQVQQKLQQLPTPTPKVANTYKSDFNSNNKLTIHFDNNKYSLVQTLTQDNSNHDGQRDNDNFFNKINDLINFLNTDDGQKFKVSIDGFSSKLFTSKYNQVLSFFRAKSIYDYILPKLKNIDSLKLSDYPYTKVSQLDLPKTDQYSNKKFIIGINGSDDATNTNSSKATLNSDVVDRKATIYITYEPLLDNVITTSKEDSIVAQDRLGSLQSQQTVQANKKIKGGEEVFFETLKANDKLIYDKYSDEIKYFSPAFHSQTPEDFNSRLTFLEQCNKQGGAVSGVTNSIFGRPPVCVLRIGDFFNTRIIITNMNKTYEPLIWDLNPEGIGMQPMICDVNLSCKLIGGSSLRGPITRLQNALDYNFYANTEVYNSIALQQSIISTKSNSTGTTTSVQSKKVNSQDLTNQTVTPLPPTSVTGDAVSNNSGGTISYTQRFDEVIETLKIWSNNLLTIVNDVNINPYIVNGQIDINTYRLNNGNTTSNLVNQIYSNLKTIKSNYDNGYNPLKSISDTGKDGNFILSTGGEFTKFQTMVNMINNFTVNFILNSKSITQPIINSQITVLTKFNNTLDIIPYTT